MFMPKISIISPNAPAPPANFSHAIVANGFVFCAGQGSRDPVTLKVVGETIEEQIERTLMNISAILSSAGSSMDNVVSTVVYLKDAAHFGALTPAWQKWFPTDPPTRATLIVVGFAIPEMMIEVVATAIA
jgi:2-iminobutanoate/2-iminopropanoate deaminase